MRHSKLTRWLPVLMGGGDTAVWYLRGGIDPSACIAAYLAKGAADIAASQVNLTNPGTYDLTTTAAPTFDTSYGWSSDGTKFWDTGYVPPRTYVYIAKFSDRVGTKYLFGADEFYVQPYYDASNHRYNWGAQFGYKNAVPVMTSGTLALANLKGYSNGVLDATASSSGNPTNTLYLFGHNAGSGLAQGIVAKIQAFAIYSAITDPQLLAVSNAMAAL